MELRQPDLLHHADVVHVFCVVIIGCVLYRGVHRFQTHCNADNFGSAAAAEPALAPSKGFAIAATT